MFSSTATKEVRHGTVRLLTGEDVDLVRDQGAPLPQVPERQHVRDPEQGHDDDEAAREERQAQHVRARPQRAEALYVWHLVRLRCVGVYARACVRLCAGGVIDPINPISLDLCILAILAETATATLYLLFPSFLSGGTGGPKQKGRKARLQKISSCFARAGMGMGSVGFRFGVFAAIHLGLSSSILRRVRGWNREGRGIKA